MSVYYYVELFSLKPINLIIAMWQNHINDRQMIGKNVIKWGCPLCWLWYNGCETNNDEYGYNDDDNCGIMDTK